MRRLWWPVLFVVVVASLAPIYLQFVGAIGPATDIAERRIIPSALSFTTFKQVLNFGVLTWLGNSLWLTAVAVAGHLLVAGLAAYAFAWKRFPGRDWLFWLLVLSMALPEQALFVPRYVLARKLGLVGYPGLLLAYWSGAGSIFLLRQFCKSLPSEVLDAARVDGAGEFSRIFRIAFPMMAPGFALVGVGVFALVWMDLFWPSLMLRGEQMTLALGLYYIKEGFNTAPTLGYIWQRMALAMAGGVISLIPMAIIFLLFQKQFERGYTEAWAE